MKCYGYTVTDEDTLAEMETVSIVANPTELREMAQFLLGCAEAIEADVEDWEHEHLKDNFEGYDEQVDFVVSNDCFTGAA